MTTQRDMGTPTDNSLAAFFPNALLPSSTGSSGGNHKLELGNGSDRRADEKTNGNSLQLLMNTNVRFTLIIMALLLYSFNSRFVNHCFVF